MTFYKPLIQFPTGPPLARDLTLGLGGTIHSILGRPPLEMSSTTWGNIILPVQEHLTC